MTPGLYLAYLGLGGGLLVAGLLLVWLGVRRPRRPAGAPIRLGLAVALLAAAAGAVGAALLEAWSAEPW